jgi:predicted helicase
MAGFWSWRTLGGVGKLSGLIESLSPDPGRRGRQFEFVSRWFFENDPLYQAELQKIWLWRDWPGRWGADAGIDLVGETHDGRLWAIQAKAYDSRYPIKKADVDTFLSESARPQFAYRLIIATTNEIGATARRTLDAQGIPVGLLLLADLEKAAVDWPASPDDLHPRRPLPKRPFPHCREAVTAVCKGFEEVDRGQLVMACGTGKTLVGLWTAERLGCERTVVLVPSLSLLAQTMLQWTSNAARPFEVLAVCSDQTVASDDPMMERTSELGVPVTSDEREIGLFLQRPGPRVVFATYQSSPRLAGALALGCPGFDLAIADEAHRCTGPVASEFATILNATAIRARWRLFMTATPRYFTERVQVESREESWDIASMDDPELFGPVFYRLSFAEAIERGLLSDYQVAIVGVHNATYRDYADRAVVVRTAENTVADARTLAAQVGLAKAMHQYDLRRVISFHSRVKWARAFSTSLPDTVGWMPAAERPDGRLWSSYVSGEMPSGHRKVLLNRLRHLGSDERGVLANARCLGEGVDVPALDGVVFIDPRRSQIDIVQAVGRAIRLSPEKKIGTVVLPAQDCAAMASTSTSWPS